MVRGEQHSEHLDPHLVRDTVTHHIVTITHHVQSWIPARLSFRNRSKGGEKIFFFSKGGEKAVRS